MKEPRTPKHVKKQCQQLQMKSGEPSTPTHVKKQRQQLQMKSGETTYIRRKRLRRKTYRKVKNADKVARCLARTKICCLCGGKAKILEHCHYTDDFRGHTCQKCNVKDGKSAKEARRHFGILKTDYEVSKCTLPDGYWELYGSELAKRIESITPEQGYLFVTGKLWKEKLLPYA